MTTETSPTTKQAYLPPRWFIRAAWIVHRWIYRTTDGRRGLQVPTEKHWGLMRLRSIGRKSGEERIAILAYVEDGPDLVTLAMNGWGAPDPAWWLNLQAQPDAVVEMKGGESRPVRARAATPQERPGLWNRFSGYYGDGYDRGAARRPGETAVVILEPRE